MRSEAEFTALYQARFGDLSAQLHAYLGDSTEAQDVVQEAFVRAWQRWSRIGEYDDPVAWVRRVAWNLATTRHRRLAVVRKFVSRSGPPETHPAATPDRVALVHALRRVPEQQRRALVLHYLADLSVADIAHDMGVADGTVKSWLHRGRKELAKLLADVPETQREGVNGDV
ncbi:MAG: SigE family RNA polymerase sigma factor [Micromonosporaceae bacterium]